MNALAVVAIVFAASFPAAELQTLDGAPVGGTLVDVSPARIVLRAASGEPIERPTDQVLALRFESAANREAAGAASTSKPRAPRAAVWIELVDGSAIAASAYEVVDGVAHVTLMTTEVKGTAAAAADPHGESPPAPTNAASAANDRQLDAGESDSAKSHAENTATRRAAVGENGVGDDATLDIPTRAILCVRLQEGTEAELGEWRAIIEGNRDGDLLVVGREKSIDYHRGVIGAVTSAAVAMQIDGEQIPVKRSKVFGLVYYHAAGGTLPASVCTVVDAAGNRWRASELHCGEGKLSWTTPSGLRLERAFDALQQLDFSGGKILYLSQIPAESVRYVPFFATRDDGAAQAGFFGPRMDSGFHGRPLRTAGKEFSRGLALHSRTEAVYRLPSRFSRLKATVGIDDEMRPNGNVQLVIRADDRVLLDETIAGDQPAREIDLDINGARRLTILVDFGADLDIGDHLVLGNVRVEK